MTASLDLDAIEAIAQRAQESGMSGGAALLDWAYEGVPALVSRCRAAEAERDALAERLRLLIASGAQSPALQRIEFQERQALEARVAALEALVADCETCSRILGGKGL